MAARALIQGPLGAVDTGIVDGLWMNEAGSPGNSQSSWISH